MLKLKLATVLVALFAAASCPVKDQTQVIQTDKCPSGWAKVTYTSTGGLKMECLDVAPVPSPTPIPSPLPTPTPLPLPTPTPVPSPTPTPAPSPTPQPSPSPSPSATPAPGNGGWVGNLPLPPEKVCPLTDTPDGFTWNHPPVQVNIGDAPTNIRTANGWATYIFNAKPVDMDPFCRHKLGDKPGLCEQWAACAEYQDRREGKPPLWWYAKYPNSSCNINSWNDTDCGVEHPTRDCDATEKAQDEANGQDPSKCGRPNAFAGRDRVGTGGGVPGQRTICVAPFQRPDKPRCHSWNLDSAGHWELVE